MTKLLLRLFGELGYALLEFQGHGVFALVTSAPPWFRELWPDSGRPASRFAPSEQSAFLENFLVDAEACWSSDGANVCQSEVWIEKSPAQKELPVQAIALRLEGKCLLVLHCPDLQYRERANLLQTARNSLLEHGKLLREIQKKEILIHCIVHDLSQPLSVMSVTFDCLAEENMNKSAKKVLDLGKSAGEQQLSMIRQILATFSTDLQATLSDEGKTNSAPDLLICARAVIDSFTPVFAAKGVKLQLGGNLASLANWQVSGEDSRLKRIFANLLENALRYSPPGAMVSIGIEDDGDFLKAYVDDEGPGLPPDHPSSQLFALFSKGQQSGGKAGLGLYFCRITVERWGGTIGCISLPEGGSRFWFRLPKADNSDQPAAAVRAGQSPIGQPLPAQTASHLRILLADDQPEILFLTRLQLERNGHHVTTASDGAKVLAALRRRRFDLLLMDEEMPGMGGLETASRIRQMEDCGGSRPVVVALTGNESDQDRQRLRAAGFDAVLAKPFRMEAFCALLQRQEAACVSLAVGRPPSLLDAQGIEDLLNRVGGDEKLLRRMINTFLHDTPRRLRGISMALLHKDGNSLSAFAHALKGSVAMFGADQAFQYSQNLENSGRERDFKAARRVAESLKEEIVKVQEKLRRYAGQKTLAAPANTRKNRATGLKSGRKKPS